MTLYASTAQIKAALRITDTVDDTLLDVAGSAASDLIDRHCERTFGTVSTSRYFAPSDGLLCQVDDLAGTAISVYTSTSANGTYDVTWATTDYQLEPVTTSGITAPFTRIRAVGNYLFPDAYGETTVKVTGVFGWPEVPPSIIQAAVIQASRLFKRLDSPLGVAGVSDIGVMRVSRGLDPDVAQLVAPFKRVGGIR